MLACACSGAIGLALAWAGAAAPAARAPAWLAAAACAAGALRCVRSARSARLPRALRLVARDDSEPRRWAPSRAQRARFDAGVVTLAGARVVHVSAGRIVLRAEGASAVVWRDAVEAATFRRLAALARWSRGGQLI